MNYKKKTKLNNNVISAIQTLITLGVMNILNHDFIFPYNFENKEFNNMINICYTYIYELQSIMCIIYLF